MNWSRGRLLAWVFGLYLALIALFGIAYWALGATSSKDFDDNLYFSLVTQSTVGFGDVVPTGIGRVLASAQIFAGVLWAALLPAIVVVRLLAPRPDTIRLSRYVAFDPEVGQFRFKLVNTGRFIGSHTNIQPWLRVVRDGGEGRRTYPVAIRAQIPYDARFPHLRPMLSTAYRTDRADASTLPASVGLICLHPAHFMPASTLLIDVSTDTPFGSANCTGEFSHTQVICGKHLDVQPLVDGPFDWSKFDEVTVNTHEPDGANYCRMQCRYRPECGLVSKV